MLMVYVGMNVVSFVEIKYIICIMVMYFFLFVYNYNKNN